ncbi:MAG: prepilin peptidase [Patescibacteria group bacterium]
MIIIIFIFGLCMGSFLNCLIWRLHEKKTILGRSICPQCKKKISWYNNIPLISFLILRGRCRTCKKKISWQYPIVELVTALLFLLAGLINFQFSIFNFHSIFNFQFSMPVVIVFFRDLIFISVLIIIFIYDLRWYLILDRITVPVMIFALAVNLYLGFGLANLAIAVVIGGGFFLTQFLISKGRWIGGGDIRLGALMGLMLGYPMIITALMLAYIFGSIFGIILLVTKKKEWSSQIPFGTFLSIATIIVMFWGEQILGWYLNLIY